MVSLGWYLVKTMILMNYLGGFFVTMFVAKTHLVLVEEDAKNL